MSQPAIDDAAPLDVIITRRPRVWEIDQDIKAIDYENYTHPEDVYKDLIYLSHEGTDNYLLSRANLRDANTNSWTPYLDLKREELCWSCGWSAQDEIHSSYGSRIRIINTLRNVGTWAVGNRWLIRDEPNDATLGNDFITQEFLRSQPSLDIPLVQEMRRLSAPTDPVVLTLMSRPQGLPLVKIWGTLSPEEKSNYKDQLVNAIKQWRQLTSPVAQKVDGGALVDRRIARCKVLHLNCKKIGRTNDEWFKDLEEDLRFGLSFLHKTKDPLVIEEKFQELKNNFPKSEPYVLTHGDMNFGNIFVKDGKIEAITGWEMSGYLPWWYERWSRIEVDPEERDELFDLVWADIDPEMDDHTFRREISRKLGAFFKVWRCVEDQAEHPEAKSAWLRPKFCECKPFAGEFLFSQIGKKIEHSRKDKG